MEEGKKNEKEVEAKDEVQEEGLKREACRTTLSLVFVLLAGREGEGEEQKHKEREEEKINISNSKKTNLNTLFYNSAITCYVPVY